MGKYRIKVVLLHFSFSEYTVQLANNLVKYVDLTLIHSEEIYRQCKDVLNPHIRVIQIKKPRIRDPRNIKVIAAMMRMIREINPDVLHVQETNDPWYDLTLLFSKMPPLVTTIHDVYRHPGDRDLTPGAEYTRRIAFYRSQQLIVHSQSLQDILIKQFRLPQQRINVLPHGELGSLFQSWSSGQIAPREPHTLLFFGRIWPYKGLKYLLQAIPLVAEHIPGVKLIIAGRGENVSELLQDADKKHYEILNNFIPTGNVANLFQRSAAVVLPYIESSQSGVAAIAYAMGTPVIASNIGGLREIVRHEQDGLLVPPCDVQSLADAIIRLLSDSHLQRQMQIAALERCQQDLNWSNIAAQTIEVYHQAIAAKSTSLMTR
ncbi:Glycosyl transferase, group 1 [Trichormus variabilis ATCC 29413]|uniref:Glycosyl transferase, group 1 n=2 Tax=Anabaena variabilis TaxID=264691 RepID=Q3M3J8_TRIV2|nr:MULTISPECIES: glycosyltransferase family 4 protein [Nostocaceae]ABA24438.1 Glycosyl transferase, group 1 [Trichormus variabilis ATCC 29413]MBC1214345.1 glycosyltransferase family 4 protein [Trichormus variabilis ARAD]MBC1258540.1 glycosyltransferase family 4 protein [Trichormus variabilis V5]MBC1268461.1 glycosyltransferase family 4 protein [Trichormus variabilis FSR]MBC1303875.1 glycosyltransferase family 4 protein [Trichormus variabilis N2B]